MVDVHMSWCTMYNCVPSRLCPHRTSPFSNRGCGWNCVFKRWIQLGDLNSKLNWFAFIVIRILLKLILYLFSLFLGFQMSSTKRFTLFMEFRFRQFHWSGQLGFSIVNDGRFSIIAREFNQVSAKWSDWCWLGMIRLELIHFNLLPFSADMV